MVRRALRAWAAALICLGVQTAAQAALFEDTEARQAILELRSRVSGHEEQLRAAQQVILELNSRIDEIEGLSAVLRGQNEELFHQVAQLQAALKEYYADFSEQLKKSRVPESGPKRKTENYDGADQKALAKALTQFRAGAYKESAAALRDFIARYPQSHSKAVAQYWLGNALYAQKQYRSSIAAMQAMLKNEPQHARAADALLMIARDHIELKEIMQARSALQQLLKQYPRSSNAAEAQRSLKELKEPSKGSASSKASAAAKS